jgi:hypothetical protein
LNVDLNLSDLLVVGISRPQRRSREPALGGQVFDPFLLVDGQHVRLVRIIDFFPQAVLKLVEKVAQFTALKKTFLVHSDGASLSGLIYFSFSMTVALRRVASHEPGVLMLRA